MSGRAAVFLDRDGVINRHLPGEYVKTWSAFVFLPGVAEAVARLRGLGYAVVVITNQQGVGKRLMSEADLEEIHRRMAEELSARGAPLDGIYACPHLAEEGCACRKPEPELIRMAVRELGLDPARSFLAGDSASDLEAARRAGCRPVYLGTDPALPADDCLVFPDLGSFAAALVSGTVRT